MAFKLVVIQHFWLQSSMKDKLSSDTTFEEIIRDYFVDMRPHTGCLISRGGLDQTGLRYLAFFCRNCKFMT